MPQHLVDVRIQPFLTIIVDVVSSQGAILLDGYDKEIVFVDLSRYAGAIWCRQRNLIVFRRECIPIVDQLSQRN